MPIDKPYGERERNIREARVAQCDEASTYGNKNTQYGGLMGGPTQARSHYADEVSAPGRAPTLRLRIDQALMAAEHTCRRAQAAQRAKEIIDQHPEFAELLDLVNQF